MKAQFLVTLVQHTCCLKSSSSTGLSLARWIRYDALHSCLRYSCLCLILLNKRCWVRWFGGKAFSLKLRSRLVLQNQLLANALHTATFYVHAVISYVQFLLLIQSKSFALDQQDGLNVFENDPGNKRKYISVRRRPKR